MGDKSLQLFTAELFSEKLFHCTFCRGVLVCPIMLINDGDNVCFPCYEILKPHRVDGSGRVNSTLDVMIRKMTFPCSFESEGCSEKIKYESFHGHVRSCKYRPITCILKNCSIVCRVKDFCNHFYQVHSDAVVQSTDDSFNILIKPQLGVVFAILKTSCGPFLVQMKLMDCTLCCIIYGEITKLVSHSFIIEFADDPQRRIYNECKVVEEFNSFLDFDEGMCTMLNLEPFNIFGDEQFMIKITFTMEEVNVKMNHSLLQLLECPICSFYMKPPIHLCKNGHSLCNSCVSKLVQCSFCKRPFEGARNYSLEELANKTMYPCAFDEQGCSVVSPIAEHHEMVCSYRLWQCPIEGCSAAYFYQNLVDHFKKQHVSVNYKETNSLLSSPFKEMWNTKSSSNIQHFVMYDLIFELTYSHCNSLHKWQVIIIGPWERHASYVFEVAVFRGSNITLNFTGPCEYKDSFKKNFISLTDVAMKQFIDDIDSFDYHVNIFKE